MESNQRSKEWVNKAAGDGEQQQARHDRQRDESQDQTGLQARAEQAAAAFENQLDEIAHDQKNQQYQQNDVDIDDEKKHDVAAEGILQRDVRRLHFEKDQRRHHQRRHRDDDALALAPFGLFGFDATSRLEIGFGAVIGNGKFPARFLREF